MDTSTMGFRMRQARLLLGISQNSVAEKLKLAKQTILKYENNRTEPSLPVVRSFASTF